MLIMKVLVVQQNELFWGQLINGLNSIIPMQAPSVLIFMQHWKPEGAWEWG